MANDTDTSKPDRARSLTSASAHTRDQERVDLIEALQQHRQFLRYTAQGLSDEQAASCPTTSQLCIGGLIKHVTMVETGWASFIQNGPSALGGSDPDSMQGHADSFRMLEGETLAQLLAQYEETARLTDELVMELPSLDFSHPLPEAPWFAPGARRSARRVILHIIAETSQHAGHADIIRESIDGQKTMG